MNSERVCKEILSRLVKEGYVKTTTRQVIENVIIGLRGPDPRTMKNWFRALEVLGFIVKGDGVLYDLQLTKVPELLTVAVSEVNQMKLL